MNHLLSAVLRYIVLPGMFFGFLFPKDAAAQSCDNWLSLPAQGSKVTIGDVDVTGNNLTVEAMFNRNPPLNNGVYYGHLVSKHTDQTNVNYALLPNGCEITTTNGYKAIFQTCVPELGKTYHVAMVYDGATLKFYRNGFLMSQVACTGNVVNNDLLTTIGQVARGDDPTDNQFLGFTNEVRIWKVARTQSQIATYMNGSLPNPTTQTGLVAYYNFNNLTNKQGNTAFNGAIKGSAVTNATNPACAFVPSSCNTLTEVTPDFIMPDTVCVNTPVNISNISMNATSNYWNFCVADANSTPEAVNLGNPGGSLSWPVFTDIISENGNYYMFVSNNWPGGLVRLDFGNSLLNNPTVVNLGTIGGVIPNTIEGIQVVKNEGRWYAIMVGGDMANGNIPSRVIKIDFGTSITNTNPVGTNWGNIGNLAYPTDLHVFEEKGIWYGFTVNAQNNTITRFNFSNSFTNTPTAVNLGNLGGLSYPTGINAIKDNGNWYVFITNDLVNSFLVRLDFGNSLLNTPTPVNLGNPGNVLRKTRDIYIMKACDQITALAVNGDGYNDLVKLDFNNNISSTPTGVSLGNTGDMNFPHSISKLFRVGNDLYTFVTNVRNHSLTRIRFPGCTSTNIPNSSLQNPPPITYTTPGTYNISLTIDDGLPTQFSVCKQVVVKDCSKPVIPDFDIPDTVCVNTPVTITNKTNGATSHYWNFCQGGVNQVPEGINLGNLGGKLSVPVFIDYVFSNGNYYGFLVNYVPGKLLRLNFGTSLLNTPGITDLGDFGGVIPLLSEGIQVVFNEGKWYAIMVAGYAAGGSNPRILKVDFGSNIANNSPAATNWGNLGNLSQPIDLHVFNDNGNWYGFTVNAENNSITRFNFGSSFDNTPTAVNFGNIGGLSYPTGIYAINDNNTWKVFVVNAGNNSRTGGNYSLTRLDFGSSLLNVPTGVNLGNPGNMLKHPRDLTIFKFCGEIVGFAVNGAIGSNDIVKIDFHNDLASIPTMTSLGNIGNLNFPHSIARIFRVNADLYSFVTNAGNNMVTRLKFAGCSTSNLPNSSLQDPPPVTYSTPGTYNINLTIDDGLPTQSSVCKQVVVLPALEHKPIQNISICDGLSIKIGSSSITGTYLWNGGATTDSISVNSSGVYWVETSRFGCTNRDSFAVTIDPPPIVDLGIDLTLCNIDNLVLDAGNSGDSYVWNNGSTGQTITINNPGTYYVAVGQNSCVVTDTIHVKLYDQTFFDFNYKQDVCNPLIIQFSGIGPVLDNSYWDFGDGNTAIGNATTTHTYTATGNYLVKYSFGTGTCVDTIRKTISINIITDNLILTADTIICYGSVKQLRTVPSLSFCWSPVTYLDNPNSPNPVTSTKQDITYFFTAEVTGANLIANGNFSQGNSGFTSQYNFAGSNTTEGQYFVGTNPQTWNSSLSSCKDHTTGNGNMMMINGSPAPDVNVWKQTVNVTPNTNYAFSTWIQALWPPNPAQLQFSINGKDAGSLITASLPTCTWTQFYTTWNSGNNTTAVISIVNKNTQVQGNDFALDDISFAPVFIKRDSVKIKIETPVVQTNSDTSFCPGGSVQLNTTGALNYSWSPAAGLSNTGIPGPVASPAVSTKYIVTGTTINGCSAKDTVNINVYTKPTIVISKDTMICKNASTQLSVTGGNTYNWSPSATLNNNLSANPVAAPVVNTKYYVKITDANTCGHLDSVEVFIKPDAVFSISNPGKICINDSLQLSASGGDIYTWQPAEGISNPGIFNPKASPTATIDYAVTITESVCNQSKTLPARVTVLSLPMVNATKSNDIDCSNDRSQLSVTGASQYVWTPATTLNNSAIYNPVARPVVTTEYLVAGTDASGCTGYDTVTVKVDNVNKSGYLMPNAFTPNSDGLNDCYSIKYWGIINEFEFSVYNRWGERLFFTKDAGQCWDGTYKGQKQDGGVYVYMIKAKTTCEPEVFRKGTFVLVR